VQSIIFIIIILKLFICLFVFVTVEFLRFIGHKK